MSQLLLLVVLLTVALATAVLVGKPGAWKKVVAAGLLFYPAILAINLFSLWMFNREVKSSLVNAGWVVDPHLLKAASAAIALLLYAGMPLIITAFVKSKKWVFVGWAALFYCGMNIILFTVSRPGANQLANPHTGISLYKYFRDTERHCVERFPATVEFHPGRIGIKLDFPDDSIVQEWKKNPCELQSTSKEPALPATTQAMSGPVSKHDFWVQGLHFKFDSCSTDTMQIVCDISLSNESGVDASITLVRDSLAVDNHGKEYRDPYLNKNGDSWEIKNSLNLQGKLAPYAKEKIRLMFTGLHERLPENVKYFQYLRFSVVLHGILTKRSYWMDFISLPIVRLVRPEADQVSRADDSGQAVQPKSDQSQPVPAPKPQSEDTDSSRVYRVGGDVSTPVNIYKVEPEYTAKARRANLQGTVIVEFVIDKYGNTRDLKVVKALGMGLDIMAMDAVSKWRFRPAKKNGQSVAVSASADIHFQLLPSVNIPPQDTTDMFQEYKRLTRRVMGGKNI